MKKYAGVRQRGKSFEFRTTIGEKRLSFYGETPLKAMRAAAEYEQKQSDGATWLEASDAWWDEKEETLSINTVNGYKVAKRRADEHFADNLLKDITPLDIKGFLNGLAAQGYARSTVKHHYVVVVGVYKYACESLGQSINTAELVQFPSGLPKSKRLMPTDKEIEIIKANCETQDGLFFYFLLYSGLRLGEALALQWDDIDKKEMTIHITKSLAFGGRNNGIIKPPKTDTGVRDVIYLQKLFDALEKHRPRGKKKGQLYAFGADGGAKPMTKTAYYNLLERYKKLGVSATPHQLRHAFATLCFEAQLPIKAAQQQLGHAQASTTEDIYTELRDKKQKEFAVLLNNTDF